jgi:hypothetical protein
MHGPINVKSPNNIGKWQMEFNSAFKGLTTKSMGKKITRQEEYIQRSQMQDKPVNQVPLLQKKKYYYCKS